MNSLLDTANAESSKIEVTGQLPARVGDVSIMTLSQAYDVFWDYHMSENNISDYYVYGVVGENGINSTVKNLQAVDLDWYKRLNKQMSISNGINIFGGSVEHIGGNGPGYYFTWYYDKSEYYSSDSGCWDYLVAPSTYVAVVRAR